MKAVPPPPDKILRKEGFLDFALWGLDRTQPEWVNCDRSKPVVHIGPGVKKVVWETDIIDYPEYNLDGQLTIGPGAKTYKDQTHLFPHLPTMGVSGMDRLPFENGTVGGIYAVCVLEHLYDISWIIREAERVLAPGCPFNIMVPHPDSIMHKEDADHKSRQVLDSWENLLNNPYYGKGKLNGIQLRVGMNCLFGVKEDNLTVVTQLIKEESE